MPKGWVLYDNSCGICSRWVPFWAPVLSRIGLEVAPLQAPWVLERLKDVPESELTYNIRLLFADGRHIEGPEVYRYIMRRLWWAYPLYMLSIIPGLRQLFDRAYRAFATHRHLFSKACGIQPRS